MRQRIAALLILATCVMLPISVFAKVFVDWRAGFHVTYPEDWHHVPYSSVTVFLQSQGLNPAQFDFDGVLAQKTDRPFFMGPFVFIGFESLGALNQGRIDSVLRAMGDQYGTRYVEGSLTADQVKFTAEIPLYDKTIKAVGLATFPTGAFSDRICLDIRKFYDRGVVTFMCYGPKETYAAVQPIFLNIVKSFSTEDLEKMAPKDSMKVVDLSQRQNSESQETVDSEGSVGSTAAKSASGKWIYFAALVLILFGVVWLINRSKKKSSNRL